MTNQAAVSLRAFAPMFGSQLLGRIGADLEMTCLDVGARRGFTDDLLPIARAVDAVGFEPDAEECERLNADAARRDHTWKGLRFVPVALGHSTGTEVLNVCRRRGCSSILDAKIDVAERFGRGDYYHVDDTIHVPTITLDDAARRHSFESAAYLKIDIEGYELEVLRSASRLLSSALLAIRSEVWFLGLRSGQPFYADIDGLLRSYGFAPMGFPELHHWRRTTRLKHPFIASGSLPYSRGQIIHGDMLFLRDADTMSDDSDAAIGQLLCIAFIALAYEYVDHAVAIFQRPRVADYLQSTYGSDGHAALATASRFLLARHRRRRLSAGWRDWKKQMRARIGL